MYFKMEANNHFEWQAGAYVLAGAAGHLVPLQLSSQALSALCHFLLLKSLHTTWHQKVWPMQVENG